MEFEKTKDGKFIPLKQKNVDTGMGLERVVAVLQNQDNVYTTDQFQPIIDKIHTLTDKHNQLSCRVISDHLRAACFLLNEGVIPSNLDQGYILRRLIRRAIRHAKIINIEDNFTKLVAEEIIKNYSELEKNKKNIVTEIDKEEQKFRQTLTRGLKKLKQELTDAANQISGAVAFDLYQSYGFPLEMTIEEAEKNNLKVDVKDFDKKLKAHQEKSRTASAGKFKGGLGDDSEMSKKYHTATHILHQALRQILGDHVQQKGSNINDQRLRFDFSHPEKLSPEQIEQVELLVNEIIKADLTISCTEKSLEQAKKDGVLAFFADKYGDKVKIYTIGDFSAEVCGGPHVQKTGNLGEFKIKKEQSSSQGIRRIKAVLE